MKCPVCTTTDLLMTDRQGVEIDYCPQCRGVWLDRGELDKIIERSSAPANEPEQQYRESGVPSSHTKHENKHDDHHEDKHHGYGGYGKPYKKKSLLKDIFDF